MFSANSSEPFEKSIPVISISRRKVAITWVVYPLPHPASRTFPIKGKYGS